MRQVIDGSRPIAAVGRDLAVIEQTLGNWVKAWCDEHAGDEPPLSVPERIWLREAERELREIRLENEFLRKQQRTLRKIARDGEVRVHRHHGIRLPGALRNQEHVPVAGGVAVGVLRLALPPALGPGAAPGTADRAGVLVVRALERDLRLPPGARRPGPPPASRPGRTWSAPTWARAGDLPRVSRTCGLSVFYAASCESVHSLRTSCGVL